MKRLGQTVGFTLIEMAIVLVVVGLLISGGLLAVGPVLNSSKTAQTNQKLDKLEQALTLYTIRYSCLPCPANGTLGTATGAAATNVGIYTTKCVTNTPTNAGASCAITNGDAVVPWGTLGLSQEDATDGWGNLISYVVDANLTLNAGSLERHTGSINYTDGALEVRDADPAGTNIITQVAAYVLISHGADGSGARTPGGQTKVNPNGTSNAVQVHNAAGTCNATTPCHQDQPYDVSGDNHFDDVVRWRTGPYIVQSCGLNACGNPTN